MSEGRSSSRELPPNQELAAAGKWPLVGEKTPRLGEEPWTVSVDGLVERPRIWTLEELRELPLTEFVVDIHCVTRWSKRDAPFRGIPLATILQASSPAADARYVSFVARSKRSHSTSLPLREALEMGVFLALEADGAPLVTEHGGPVRTVAPGRYFYKSLKWLERIEVLAEDRLGYWEAEAGYHNVADPWLEQRYMAPKLDRREARRLLEQKNFEARDLRSMSAEGRDLRDLRAEDAQLRDANFQRSDLRGARFDRANLSNAHFEKADLREASFAGSDCEGADFRGADLRGATFAGASLFGSTFSGGDDDPIGDARVDGTTTIERAQLKPLSDAQRAFVLERVFGGR